MGQPRVRGEHVRTSDCGRSGQPRVRGEHLNTLADTKKRYGSAPRARGTLINAFSLCVSRRVSPACAGNTSDHAPSREACRRVSPACAGNTPTPGLAPGQPRVRGEHLLRSVVLRVSPACAGNTARFAARVSPACAGNTCNDRLRVPGQPRAGKPTCDAATAVGRRESGQPRVRGEHHVARDRQAFSSGSAPRARGTQKLNNSTRNGSAPRARGTHTCHTPGSAPRARGTLFSKATDSTRFFC